MKARTRRHRRGARTRGQLELYQIAIDPLYGRGIVLRAIGGHKLIRYTDGPRKGEEVAVRAELLADGGCGWR